MSLALCAQQDIGPVGVRIRSGTLSALKPPQGFPCGSGGKASAYNAGDLGSIPGLGSSPGEENGNPLQYSCLENHMDGGAQ